MMEEVELLRFEIFGLRNELENVIMRLNRLGMFFVFKKPIESDETEKKLLEIINLKSYIVNIKAEGYKRTTIGAQVNEAEIQADSARRIGSTDGNEGDCSKENPTPKRERKLNTERQDEVPKAARSKRYNAHQVRQGGPPDDQSHVTNQARKAGRPE
ncbi:hypothetical protein CHUAL_011365 [Chamberlinius hualienensis]